MISDKILSKRVLW